MCNFAAFPTLTILATLTILTAFAIFATLTTFAAFAYCNATASTSTLWRFPRGQTPTCNPMTRRCCGMGFYDRSLGSYRRCFLRFVFFFAGALLQHGLLFFLGARIFGIFFCFCFFGFFFAFYNGFFVAVSRCRLDDAFAFWLVVGSLILSLACRNSLFIKDLVHELLLVQFLGSCYF